MATRTNRRAFMKTALAAGAALGTGVFATCGRSQEASPNEKLNVACIGVKNRASANVGGVSGENIVALCDVDDNYLNEVGQQYPKAKKYNDFRRLLDQEKTLDAIVVSTPDHIHAPASLWGMQLGLHCYCEKPLTHSVHEARLVAGTAKEQGVATQMGTQIHAGDNYRRVVEIVQSGAIGEVTDVHVWVGKAWGGGERPQDTPPVPGNLHWDLWVGPAPYRPYHPTYLPGNWRRWWDFGQGTLGDMACHLMDLPYWALGLRHPSTIEAEGPPVHPETAPVGLTVRYEYEETDDHGDLSLTWYDGDHIPKEIDGYDVPGMGVMFVGEKGHLFADYGAWKLYPEADFADFEAPPRTIPDSPGHYAEWIQACKEGTPTTCNFDYSGALSEAVLLGNVAYRAGQKLEWDAEDLRATNCPEADQYIRRPYREGWAPPGIEFPA